MFLLFVFRILSRYYVLHYPRNGSGESTQQLSRMELEDQVINKPRHAPDGADSNLEKQKEPEMPRSRSSSPSLRPYRSQLGLGTNSLDLAQEDDDWPHVGLRLQGIDPGVGTARSPELTSVEGTFSGLTSSLGRMIRNNRGKQVAKTAPLTVGLSTDPLPRTAGTSRADEPPGRLETGDGDGAENENGDRRSVMSARQREKQPRREPG